MEINLGRNQDLPTTRKTYLHFLFHSSVQIKTGAFHRATDIVGYNTLYPSFLSKDYAVLRILEVCYCITFDSSHSQLTKTLLLRVMLYEIKKKCNLYITYFTFQYTQHRLKTLNFTFFVLYKICVITFLSLTI